MFWYFDRGEQRSNFTASKGGRSPVSLSPPLGSARASLHGSSVRKHHGSAAFAVALVSVSLSRRHNAPSWLLQLRVAAEISFEVAIPRSSRADVNGPPISGILYMIPGMTFSNGRLVMNDTDVLRQPI